MSQQLVLVTGRHHLCSKHLLAVSAKSQQCVTAVMITLHSNTVIVVLQVTPSLVPSHTLWT